jgi:opacity protein-like surface antigen
MCSRIAVALLSAALSVSLAASAQAQDRWRVDFENGAAIAGYNDVRIPGDTGTLFSLTDDLASDTAYFWRVRADVRLGRKHVLSALVAPLTLHASGTFDQPVAFAGATFAPGVPTTGLYVFNSYRVTYRYELIRRENWMFGFGVTVKVRDAETRLEAGGTSAAKTNVGAVPLVNFKFERRLGGRATFLLEGDALAAPQGRAEDIFAGILVHAGKQWSIKAGYRFLEGGADNDEVYTFALVHYVAAGVVVRF